MVSTGFRRLIALPLLCAAVGVIAAQSTDAVEKSRQHIGALASKVLGEHQQFVLLHMPAGSDVEAGANQLGGILGDIKRPKGVVLVIGSEDTTAIASIVKKGFATVARNSLAGCIVVFVGAMSEQQSVGEAVAKSGAQFRFVEFQP